MNEGYKEVLRSIASSEPTPGGGSVAALALAHAHSLAMMVARLTGARRSGQMAMKQLNLSFLNHKLV